MAESIIERLIAQRTMLLDIVKQMENAIAIFGGVLPVVHAPVNGERVHWTKNMTPKQRRAWLASMAKSRRKKKRPYHQRTATIPEQEITWAQDAWHDERYTVPQIASRLEVSPASVYLIDKKRAWGQRRAALTPETIAAGNGSHGTVPSPQT